MPASAIMTDARRVDKTACVQVCVLLLVLGLVLAGTQGSAAAPRLHPARVLTPALNTAWARKG